MFKKSVRQGKCVGKIKIEALQKEISSVTYEPLRTYTSLDVS